MVLFLEKGGRIVSEDTLSEVQDAYEAGYSDGYETGWQDAMDKEHGEDES